MNNSFLRQSTTPIWHRLWFVEVTPRLGIFLEQSGNGGTEVTAIFTYTTGGDISHKWEMYLLTRSTIRLWSWVLQSYVYGTQTLNVKEVQAIAWEATVVLLLPWLRCGGFSAPLLPTHAGVLRLGLVQGGLGHRLGGGCEKVKCHSPATAASSAPEGCPPCSLRSLEDKHQRHRSEFQLDQSESPFSSPS